LLEFALVVMLFQFANAPMLPLVGSFMTTQSAANPGRHYRDYNPRHGTASPALGPLLLIVTGALVFRGLLFAFVRDPYLLVVIQVLDGMSAAVLSVLIPLVVVDVTYGSGHFNLAQGFVGTATGLGASISMVFAGYLSGRFGNEIAFLSLTASAATAFALADDA
jgi:MFS family permease